MSSTSPRIAELIEALPAEAKEPSAGTSPLEQLLQKLAHKQVPIGRFNRLWVLGTLQAKIAAAYLAWWIRQGYADADKRDRTLNETHLKAALKLLGGMSYLRGAIMKVGQIIATHPDVAPEEFADALGHLHFEAPPMHFSLLREFVRTELGADPTDIFDEFETKAFAAASLGQVHRARLKGSGQLVAVKIQYPNIGRTIRDDFRNLMAFLLPMRLIGDWDSMKEQMEDVRRMLDLETDYEHEAENLRIARSAFSEDEGIVVPRVYPEVSTRRVLTMDYIDGLHLHEFLATKPDQSVCDELGRKIGLSVFRLFYGKRLVYADPQPGNYLFMPDGRLGMIDFGCCHRLSDSDVTYMGDVERAGRTSREVLREALIRGLDLTPKQAADEKRLKLATDWCLWIREPVDCQGPFDFGDLDYFRRGVGLYGELVRRRYTRARPASTWFTKCAYGMRAMFAHLKAKFDLGEVFRGETIFSNDKGA
jgi:predicted unusual protein kinase regulating ubiquinone biosynthesis (AarF/ABC1/UbiB family)